MPGTGHALLFAGENADVIILCKSASTRRKFTPIDARVYGEGYGGSFDMGSVDNLVTQIDALGRLVSIGEFHKDSERAPSNAACINFFRAWRVVGLFEAADFNGASYNFIRCVDSGVEKQVVGTFNSVLCHHGVSGIGSHFVSQFGMTGSCSPAPPSVKAGETFTAPLLP